MKPWLLFDSYMEDPEGGAGNFLPLLQDRPVKTVRLIREPLPEEPRDYAGVVITGSAAGVRDGYTWVDDLMEFLRLAVDRDVPILGVCFGHQALAEAALGRGSVRRAPTPEVGWYDVQLTAKSTADEDPLLAGLPRRFRTFLSHYDEVEPSVAGRLDVLARTDACDVQAFRLPGKRAWGVQFHAEMLPAETERLVRKRVGVTVPGDPEAVLRGAVDSGPLIRRLIQNFAAAAADR